MYMNLFRRHLDKVTVHLHPPYLKFAYVSVFVVYTFLGKAFIISPVFKIMHIVSRVYPAASAIISHFTSRLFNECTLFAVYFNFDKNFNFTMVIFLVGDMWCAVCTSASQFVTSGWCNWWCVRSPPRAALAAAGGGSLQPTRTSTSFLPSLVPTIYL